MSEIVKENEEKNPDSPSVERAVEATDTKVECSRCQERGKTWRGSDPVCSFPDGGEFDSDGYRCATANALRDLAEDWTIWSQDQNAALIEHDGQFIVLSWYKNRGRTEGAWLLSSYNMIPLTLADAERFITAKTNEETKG